MRPIGMLSLALLALVACGAPSSDPSPSPGSTGSAGTAGPGANDPGAGLPVNSVSFERLDASAECDGIVPESAPAPVAVRRTPPPGAACAGGLSDGTGHVAVAARDASGASWQVFAQDGSPLRTFSAWPTAPQPEGFDGLRTSAGPDADRPLVEHVAIAADGSERSAVQVSGDPQAETWFKWSFGADPSGGALVLFRSTAIPGNHWHVVRAQRFGASGDGAWPQPARLEYDSDPTSPVFMAGAVSTGGEPLALWQRSGLLVAAWLDGSGNPTTTGAAEGYANVLGGGITYAPHDLELVPLLDGGLALRCDGTFRRAYAHLQPASVRLPDWLASRTAWSFRFARARRAYAVFPPAGAAAADCTQAIDLVSAGGRLCGRAVLHEDGSGCTTGAVDAGWDGTVVQQSGTDPCVYRWWPGLLR